MIASLSFKKARGGRAARDLLVKDWKMQYNNGGLFPTCSPIQKMHPGKK